MHKFFLLGFSFCLLACSAPKSEETAKTIADAPVEATAETNDKRILRELKATLDKQGLTLCDVYQWIGNSENEIRRNMETTYGMPAAMKMVDERNQAYDKAWEKYRKQHSLSDSVRGYINVFGVKECQ